MADCVFCRMVQGEIPVTKVYEDESCLAFMDIHPLAEGHTLLIPKTHAETLDQLDAAQAGQMLRNLPALVAAARDGAGAAGVNVLQNNGKVAHQEVPHVHFHIIPRTRGDKFHFNWPAGSYPEGRLEALAGEIRARLG
ncbi:MAG: HIT family protein [Planctomycetota bacterium]